MNLLSRQTVRRLSPLDAAFLNLETRDTPMHIASLQIYSLPADAPSDFIRQLVQRFRSVTMLASPFGLKLSANPLTRLAPAMIHAADIDMDYHVRHSALPGPAGERELGELVSHLHSQLLDRTRPLWTCHVIEGLHGNRFALYIKMHHALADGISSMRIMARSLAMEPDGEWFPAWEHRSPRPRSAARQVKPPAQLPARRWPQAMIRAIRPLFQREPGTAAVLRPFEAPHSLLNGRVTNARRVATQQLDLARVKRLAKLADCSLNDVFLATCSAALRRHLLNQGELPQQPLIAGVPVSLREPGDDSASNAVGYLWAALGTDIADPRQRLAAIRASMEVSKQHLKQLPAPVRQAFVQLTMLPGGVVMMSGLGARLRPPMNLTISNVPGPDRLLYLAGARLEALYPVSIPAQGQALNITCVSYAGQLNVGFTGSRDSLPHLQRMAVYAGEALEELESVFSGEV